MNRPPNRVPWVNVVAGILIIISPFVATMHPANSVAWDMVITGAVIAIAAVIEMTSSAQSGGAYWPLLSVVAGIWLFVSTAWLAGNSALVWSNIVLGLVTIVTALVALSYERLGPRPGG